MASETAPESAGGTSGTTETLRRVKQVETDLDAQLAAAKAETEELLSRVRSEVDQSVRTAQAEAEKSRELSVSAARAQMEAEAEAIRRAGEAEARQIEAGLRVDLSAQRSKLLDIVFSGFREASED